MLDYDQRTKLSGKWGDSVKPQDKANFNKNMRKKLKLWLKEMPDMIMILDGLPPRVIENASLLDDLPKVIEFVDKFLEKADPLPVAVHESGERRTFRNDAIYHGQIDECWESHVKIINNKKYLIRSSTLTASPVEIRVCDVLRKHLESMQRYIDPSIVAIDGTRKQIDANKAIADMYKRRDMMGACSMAGLIVEGEIPTKPPCRPRGIVEGKILDFQMMEEEPK